MNRQIETGEGIERRAAVARLLENRGDLLVVTGLGSSTYDVFAAGDHDANFYLWGAMGGAALVGLGLALAQPGRPVAVITGDGEQLMGLGGLATVATRAPGNLSIVVLDNGHFGETGNQVSHAGLGVDLSAVARAAGFKSVATASTMDEVAAAAETVARIGQGPRFIRIRILNQETPRALPLRDGAAIKTRFRAHLGLKVG